MFCQQLASGTLRSITKNAGRNYLSENNITIENSDIKLISVR